MIHLEFVRDDAVITYDYMPERKDASRGTVAVNWVTGERTLVRKAGESELSWYRGHAWRRVEQMLEDGDLRKENCSVWYYARRRAQEPRDSSSRGSCSDIARAASASMLQSPRAFCTFTTKPREHPAAVATSRCEYAPAKVKYAFCS